jgi:CYTH domain-containing protein
MAREIERKFLVEGTGYKEGNAPLLYRQGYLNTGPERTVRIRVAGDKGFITIKGRTEGITRSEFEYEIPVGDADIILNTLCDKPIIEKLRYLYEHEGRVWEIDEFLGENEGLIVAETELESEEEDFSMPVWISAEVSDDPRYFNSNLIRNPYRKWRD